MDMTDQERTAARNLALHQTREDYAQGRITPHELDRRIAILLGSQGQAAQDEALATTRWVNVTSFGSTSQQWLPARWQWCDH